jgi:hypothetical protein
LLASAYIDLPFRFKAENLVYRDSVEAPDLGDSFTTSEVDSAGLRILYDNGLPLTTQISIYGLMTDGVEQELVSGLLIEAAEADSSGKTLPNGHQEGLVQVLLDTAALEVLEQAEKLIVEVHFQTPDAGNLPATLYTDYQVQFKVGLFVDFNQ